MQLIICEEPKNLSEWKLPFGMRRGRLFTCGRPGRATFGREKRLVDDETIHIWVKALPEADPLYIVSLLGRKRGGFSEFGYYPFRSSKEPERKPTFQKWLDDHYEGRFAVREFPTVDARPIPPEVLDAVKVDGLHPVPKTPS